MNGLPDPLKQFLKSLGLKETTQRYKFGGIVGKVALTALGGFAATAAVARFTSGNVQVFAISATLVTTLLVIRWTFRYAEKHPSSATLEGAEIILWQQQQIVLAAKNTSVPAQGPIIPNPGGAPPLLNPAQGDEE